MTTMNRMGWAWVLAAATVYAAQELPRPTGSPDADAGVPWRMDFENVDVGKVPVGMRILDGAFAVGEEGENRYLELPGAPLESYGALFGPSRKEGVAVSARILGTGKGRRYPTFGVGLSGVSGYRLQVSPGKGKLELFKGEEDKRSVPFAWTSGRWIHLRLQVRSTKPGAWIVEGRVWSDGQPEPKDWTLRYEENEEPKAGRPGLFGSPFAGTPIRYDDLEVLPAAEP